MKRFRVSVHSEEAAIQFLELSEGEYTFGTGELSNGVLRGEGIAERHVVVWLMEGRMQVEDLAGGVTVNGYAISERVEVEVPASVELPGVTLLVEEFAEAGPVQDLSSDVTIPVPRNEHAKELDSEATIPVGRRGPAARKTRSETQAVGQDKAPLTGEYTLVKEIARGGMGQIYFGEDPQLKREVAVKVSSLAHGGMDPRFVKEAEVLAQLAHPNVVPIYAIGTDGQRRPYYSMKLVKGQTLQAVLNDLKNGDAAATKEYSRATLLTIFRKVCDAMMFAHSKRILHRDLKPENIMVGEYGEVLVMDWGLAKVLGEKEAPVGMKGPVSDSGNYGMTMEGDVMGTPQYMSPEQAEGMVAGLDERSDIYSLGGILYAILTLRPPIEGKTLNEVLTKVKKGEISSMITRSGGKDGVQKGMPSAIGGEVPEALRAVTHKAMATDRKERYASMEAFAADVEAYQHGFATSAEHAGFARQIVLLVKRNRGVSALCALLLVSALVFSMRLIASERKAVQERTAAQILSAKAQIALAQSEHQARNSKEMRRILDEVPREYRDQHWAYLDAKLAPPPISFEIPEAPVEVAFSTNRAPGCFLSIQRNGDVRYLDPAMGFGSPLFQLAGPIKDLALAFYEGAGRMWLAVVTNRTVQLGDKSYPASLEVLEVPSGALVYKVGISRPCAVVDFSPQGNLLCLGRRPPASAMLQMQNAYTGEMIWEGGGKDAGFSAFSKDENRLVYAIEGKGGFQHLDSWTGKEQGPLIKGSARVGAWSPGADRVYAAWHYAERMMLRATHTTDGSNRFEHPLSHSLPRNAILSKGNRLILATTPSPDSRIVEVLDSNTGAVIDTTHLLGNYGIFAVHSDESHLLCLNEKRAAFLQWDFPESSIKGFPEFQGLWFLDGAKLAACTPKNNKWFLKIYDLTKPRVDPGGAFSIWVSPNSVFFNRDRTLVLFRDGAKSAECVVAKIEPKGMTEISRWKCPSKPQLSPSGNRAWARDAVYETATGKQFLSHEREDSRETISARWLDESRVLELQALRRKDEEAPDELYGNGYVMWEAETGKTLLRLQEPRALTFESSPDGRWIAEGGIDGRLRIRSAQTLAVYKEYKVHDMQVTEVLWHPTKPVILTAARGEHFVKAWDHRDGSLVQSFRCWKFPLTLGLNGEGGLLGITHNGNPLILPLDLSRVRD